MNRSDFLSAMAALFCGVLLPIPQREAIRIATGSEITRFSASIPINQEIYDRVMQDPRSFQALANKIFNELMWDKWCQIEARQVYGTT